MTPSLFTPCSVDLAHTETENWRDHDCFLRDLEMDNLNILELGGGSDILGDGEEIIDGRAICLDGK
jgi:hypothetical protein